MTKLPSNLNIAILSAPIMLEDGVYVREEITKEAALKLINEAESVINYSTHSTCRVLNLEPATSRAECTSYKHALVIKPNQRLEFGKEYTLEEIQNMDLSYIFICRLGDLYG